MLQELMTSPGEISFIEKDIPEPKDGEVLLKIMRIGVCGSDIHVYHGTHPYTKYPVVQGHEVSGIVVSVGDNVSEDLIGKKATVEPQVFCGKCYNCLHGKYNLCENLKVMGFQTTGLASEYAVVEMSKVTLLPDNMTFNDGAMIEPLAVAVHAVKKAGEIENKNVVVIGTGPIGNLVAQTAKGMGASKVITVDISNYRLDISKICGADFIVNTKSESLKEIIKNEFGQEGSDIIFDCAGNDESIGEAISLARKGSIIMLVAVFSKIATVDLAMLNDHELDLKTTMMYKHEDYIDAINLVSTKKVMLSPLVSNTFEFKDYKKAYQYIDDNREKTLKVLINVGG
jgi:L-iditol 2-dehydrogenase